MLLNLLEESASSTPQSSNPTMFIILGVFVVLMIGMFIWQNISNKKKQKQAEEKVEALKIGDRIKTIGGVCGFLVEMNKEENTFVLETGTNDKKSYIKFDRAAIYQTAPASGANVVTEQVKEQTEQKAEETVAVKEEPKKTTRRKKVDREEI